MYSEQQRRKMVALALMADLQGWRERAIERIELSSRIWSVRTREIHVHPLLEAQQGHARKLLKSLEGIGGAEKGKALLLLPLTRLSKRALLDFHVTVDGRAVHRLSRAEGAKFQAHYIEDTAKGVARVREGLIYLLAAIFGTTFEREDENESREVLIGRVEKRLGFAIPACRVAWGGMEAYVEGVVTRFTLPNESSASLIPLLALPYLNQLLEDEGKIPLNDAQLARQLRTLSRFLRVMERSGEQGRSVQELYSIYGSHWETLAYCTVPLNRRFIISITSKRNIYFVHPKGIKVNGLKSWWEEKFLTTVWSHVSFADAQTNHVNVRVPDFNVELNEKHCLTLDEKHNQKLENELDHLYATDELYSIYSSKSGREEGAWVKCRLRVTASVAWVQRLIFSAVVATFFAVLLQWGDLHRPLAAPHLALLLTPTTFAASLILVRESSPLSSRLTNRVRRFIRYGLSVLWGGVIILYLTSQIQGSNSDSGRVEVAEMVQKCEKAHNLESALDSTLRNSIGTFASCNWPPRNSADPDGYTAIVVRAARVSTTGTKSLVDRITGPCKVFELSYTQRSPDGVKQLSQIKVKAEQRLFLGGESVAHISLPFVPLRGEADVVHSGQQLIDQASCFS
ncbi:hypothetical protein [Streptomyces sp. NBC_01800]|uniref:hypothetical protein n=1 Tax=Streptomyces sp. NBC_01800 TaxID=2975945 RepID=UPI002DDB17CC|nr:hypothetical protein [Streptomyces sp. NBC_01800]WSA67975.1 hypothetical protein OIE65_13865 [Streptomyces sp. NBC_01800]